MYVQLSQHLSAQIAVGYSKQTNHDKFIFVSYKSFYHFFIKIVICILLTISYLNYSREFTHRVKSVSMAKFTHEEVTALQAGGNEVCMIIFFFWFSQLTSY